MGVLRPPSPYSNQRPTPLLFLMDYNPQQSFYIMVMPPHNSHGPYGTCSSNLFPCSLPSMNHHRVVEEFWLTFTDRKGVTKVLRFVSRSSCTLAFELLGTPREALKHPLQVWWCDELKIWGSVIWFLFNHETNKHRLGYWPRSCSDPLTTWDLRPSVSNSQRRAALRSLHNYRLTLPSS